LGKRSLHLVDSLVTLLSLGKGRSSSGLIKGMVRRTNCVVLASSIIMLLGFVGTLTNPADRPSRWHVS
jgi:hypothetical protein